MCVVFSPNGTHPFDMGDFRVLATRALAGGFAVAAQPTFRKLRFLQRISRRTQVRLRGAVLLKSPHLKRLRSARPLARPSGSRYARRFPTKASLSSAHLGANKRRRWHYRHRSTGRLVALHSLRYFVSAPPAAIIAESASPCFVARLRFRLTRT